MALPDIAWGDLTDEELRAVYDAAGTETTRREQLIAIPKSMEALHEAYAQASHGQAVEEWQQPTEALSSYPKGWEVVKDGKNYKSRIPFNATVPGEDPDGRWWEDLTTVVEQGAWAPNMTVIVGQAVSYEGKTYAAIQAHTTQAGWEPPAVPALWRLVVAPVTPVATPGQQRIQ